jgi:hypothetical protein
MNTGQRDLVIANIKSLVDYIVEDCNNYTLLRLLSTLSEHAQYCAERNDQREVQQNQSQAMLSQLVGMTPAPKMR